MRFIATADTDIGIIKKNNQDALLIKHANTSQGEIMMAVICDGMGGLEKGEIASATVISTFSEWFHKELPKELKTFDINVIGEKWELMLKELNFRLLDHGKLIGVNLGTTFSGILMIKNQYMICHVGDTRVYYLDKNIDQITHDQTVIAREISRGMITPEQAKTDKRRNMLLQCIGASKEVEPEVIYGKVNKGVYMICSDGFRHKVTEEELYENLKPSAVKNKEKMQEKSRFLIDLVKNRNERDNISVILIKAE